MSWISAHQHWFWGLTLLSAVMFFVSPLVIAWIITRLDPEYFVGPEPPPNRWSARHPALRITTLVLKNALGLVLLVSGIAMLVLPGQGLLAMMMGVLLLNFPGKRRLEQWFIGRPRILHTINWLRCKANCRPLITVETINSSPPIGDFATHESGPSVFPEPSSPARAEP